MSLAPQEKMRGRCVAAAARTESKRITRSSLGVMLLIVFPGRVAHMLAAPLVNAKTKQPMGACTPRFCVR